MPLYIPTLLTVKCVAKSSVWKADFLFGETDGWNTVEWTGLESPVGFRWSTNSSSHSQSSSVARLPRVLLLSVVCAPAIVPPRNLRTADSRSHPKPTESESFFFFFDAWHNESFSLSHQWSNRYVGGDGECWPPHSHSTDQESLQEHRTHLVALPFKAVREFNCGKIHLM